MRNPTNNDPIIVVILLAIALVYCGCGEPLPGEPDAGTGYVCKRVEPALCADTSVIEYVCPDPEPSEACTWQPRAYPCEACVEWERTDE